jgi:3',5'-nucleoside bisphosphate phosphatase
VPEPPESSHAALVDLHAHTTASDGSLSPAELVSLAKRRGLAALAVTDHDTFDGYEQALPFARDAGLDVVRGIELNSRLKFSHRRDDRSVHLLGYWPSDQASGEFMNWLESEREYRRSRNRRLVQALQSRGIDIALEEVEARGGSLTGRVHFARVLVDKAYAQSQEDAFRRYLGEDAPSYVERQSETTENAIRRIRAAGGIPALAHPIRLSLSPDNERDLLLQLKDAGLLALEIYHSEHPPELQAHYRQLAEEFDLLPTGGSDFHGAPKPEIELGTGMNGNVRVPREFLDRMKQPLTMRRV